jgi:hypothetical protein
LPAWLRHRGGYRIELDAGYVGEAKEAAGPGRHRIIEGDFLGDLHCKRVTVFKDELCPDRLAAGDEQEGKQKDGPVWAIGSRISSP